MKQEIIGIQIGKEEVKLPTNLRPRIREPRSKPTHLWSTYSKSQNIQCRNDSPLSGGGGKAGQLHILTNEIRTLHIQKERKWFKDQNKR